MAKEPNREVETPTSVTNDHLDVVDYNNMDNEDITQHLKDVIEKEGDGGAIPVPDFDDPDDVSKELFGDDDVDPDSNFNDELEKAKSEQDPDPTEKELSVDEKNTHDEDEQPEMLKSVRVRLQPNDDHEAQALDLKKRNPDMSLAECLERTAPSSGDAKGDTEGERTDNNKKNALESEYENTQREIDELENEQLELTEEMEFTEAAKKAKEIRLLDKKLSSLHLKIEQQKTIKKQEEQSLAEQEYIAAEQESKAKAVMLYPDVTNENSRMVARMVEINDQLKDADDDLYFSPEKHLKLAQMAARDLSIAPRKEGGAIKERGSSPNSPQVSPAQGSMRTSTTNQSTLLEKGLATIDTVEEMEDFLSKI